MKFNILCKNINGKSTNHSQTDVGGGEIWKKALFLVVYWPLGWHFGYFTTLIFLNYKIVENSSRNGANNLHNKGRLPDKVFFFLKRIYIFWKNTILFQEHYFFSNFFLEKMFFLTHFFSFVYMSLFIYRSLIVSAKKKRLFWCLKMKKKSEKYLCYVYSVEICLFQCLFQQILPFFCCLGAWNYQILRMWHQQHAKILVRYIDFVSLKYILYYFQTKKKQLHFFDTNIIFFWKMNSALFLFFPVMFFFEGYFWNKKNALQ